jgi:predicted YcjX-like family ATPase
MSRLTNLTDEALIVFDNVVDYATNLGTPTIRLGVTGLSRSGKTVFITSLVHNLINGGTLPMFEPIASGRVAGARLEPQPSMNLPRFAYEDHLALLTDQRQWPKSTVTISELRVTVAFESASAWNRTFGSGKLNIDIVDYPGEWLLDLPLLAMDYQRWSAQALEMSDLPNRKKLARQWRNEIKKTDADAPLVETKAIKLAEVFTEYLRACRQDDNALSTLPPGRFLMPGDMEGSPALTFCPLPTMTAGLKIEENSLYHQMAQRYEAYKTYVVKPFFRDHFVRLDRQIILVDALQAINAGPAALSDLETALSEILKCFSPGQSNWLTSLFNRRIDRVLFAATKVDHLHHENHKKLESLLRALVDNGLKRAKFAGASVDVMALCALRSTSEAVTNHDGETLPVIVGTPIKDEVIDGMKFDGETKTAIFPGDLPDNPSSFFGYDSAKNFPELSFVRFRPPPLGSHTNQVTVNLPHIRLDKALQFLLSDQLA